MGFVPFATAVPVVIIGDALLAYCYHQNVNLGLVDALPVDLASFSIHDALPLIVLIHAVFFWVFADNLLVQPRLWAQQLSCMLIPASSPFGYLDAQWEAWSLLKLEAIHLIELRRNKRYGITDIGAGLPHVDTSHAKGKGKGKGGMKMNNDPVVKDLVFVGGGHAHAFILKNFGMKPVPGVQVTLVTREVDTPYSGMLPGHVAGMYTREECHIDLVRLARFAGARYIQGECIGVDRDRKRVLIANRPSIPYDVLSIDIGSTPATQSWVPKVPLTPVKPIDGFSARWNLVVDKMADLDEPMKIVVVGAGAGGTEIALSMHVRLRDELEKHGRDPDLIEMTLLSRSKTVCPSHNVAVQAKFMRILEERGIHVGLECDVVDSVEGGVWCSNGKYFECTELFWCTQAGTQAWLKGSGFEVDKGGFINVSDNLESVNTPGVFAAGDCAAMVNHPRPKAGVFAVRAGPPLAQNIRNLLTGRPLEPYYPQSKFLGIIGTGLPSLAIASKGSMALEGAWLWDLKDWIDRKWMADYTTSLPEMGGDEPEIPEVARTEGPAVLEALAHASMRCGGCGAKVGSTVLSRVMARLDVPMNDTVVVGIDAPDDAALITPPKPDHLLVQTVDFFRSFLKDPFIFGQIAANHALSDLHAMGATADSALAICVLPYAVESKVEDQLYQLMSGACKVLRDDNCALVGGHTCEGAELALGFACNGSVKKTDALRKGGSNVGDKLIITKGVGTGTLMAAEMRVKAKGQWVSSCIRSMLQSNRDGGVILRNHGATACTDVTGFGVLGHLVEMTKASKVSTCIYLDSLPILEGAMECVSNGIFSSLQPSNLRLKRALSNEAAACKHAAYPLLFDPQTAGGLLATVPAKKADACVAALKKAGYPETAIIGEVLSQDGAATPVSIMFDSKATPEKKKYNIRKRK